MTDRCDDLAREWCVASWQTNSTAKGELTSLAALLRTTCADLEAENAALRAVALGGKLCISEQHKALKAERDSFQRVGIAAEAQLGEAREALQRISDGDDECDCDHDDEKCCALVGVYCAHCITGRFLSPPQPQAEKCDGTEAGLGCDCGDVHAHEPKAEAPKPLSDHPFTPCEKENEGLPGHNFTCMVLCDICGQPEAAHKP